MLTPEVMHRQYLRQAEWTRPLRDHLFRRAHLTAARDTLEVGCGTGAIAAEIARRTRSRVVGLDHDREALVFARANSPAVEYIRGDAHALPFPPESFDVVFCHYFLLWARDPTLAVREMRRVCRPGGYVVAGAEPDYGGRIDYPSELAMGEFHSAALWREGADPHVGRRLRHLFVLAGLRPEVGVTASIWSLEQYARELDREWDFLATTASHLLSPARLAELREIDRRAVAEGSRLALMPVFYALARA